MSSATRPHTSQVRQSALALLDGLRRRSAPSSSSRAYATSTAWPFVSGRGAAHFIAGAEWTRAGNPYRWSIPMAEAIAKLATIAMIAVCPQLNPTPMPTKKAEQRPTRKDDPLGFEHYLFCYPFAIRCTVASILALEISESSVQSWLLLGIGPNAVVAAIERAIIGLWDVGIWICGRHSCSVCANSCSGLARSVFFARISRLPLVGAAEGGQFDTNITASPAAASA